MTKKIIFFCFFFFPLGISGNVFKLHLNEYIREVLENNFSIQESLRKSIHEKNSYEIALDKNFPRFDLKISMDKSKDEKKGIRISKKDLATGSGIFYITLPYLATEVSFIGTGRYEYLNDDKNVSAGYLIKLKQPLLRGLPYEFNRIFYKKQRLNFEVQQLERKKIIKDVILTSLAKWWSYYLAEKSFQSAQKNYQRKLQGLEIQKLFFALGRIDEITLIDNEIELSGSKIDVVLKEQEKENEKNELLLLMGRQINSTNEVDLELITSTNNFYWDSIKKIENLADPMERLYKNFTVAIAERNVTLAGLDIKEKENDTLMNLDFSAEYGETFYQNVIPSDQDFKISLDFVLPVYQKVEQNNLEKAREIYDLSILKKQNILYSLKNQFHQNLKNLSLKRKQLEHIDKKIFNEKKKFDRDYIRFKNEDITSYQLDDINLQIIFLEREKWGYWVEKINLELNLFSMLGELPEEILSPILEEDFSLRKFF